MDRLTQQLSGFSDLVREVWVTGVGGVDFGRALTALAIVLGFLILRGLFTRFVLGFLRRIAARTQTTMDDSLLGALDGPVRLVPIILGLFIAIDYLAFEDRYAEIGAQVVRTLVVFDIFWGLYQITGPISTTFTRLEEILTKEMADWLIGFLHIAIVFIGAATILEVWGINIGPILAGLGVFGVAVAVGAQDLFKYLFGGILVIAEKRMRVGDWI
ncbi:MAG: mechanosensitive ion channel, partial [Pirellulaceae bacterium]|nr:mechanosensitive ion channel [Pirellulaceae bacterium]